MKIYKIVYALKDETCEGCWKTALVAHIDPKLAQLKLERIAGVPLIYGSIICEGDFIP